jgi:3-hydroxyisobutyrate dehydrogenase
VSTKVTVLGTGLMGSGMARSLARAGLDVAAWNRTPDKARALADAGVTVHEDLATAVSEADVVLTMLFDADSVATVIERALPSMRENAIWLQTSTVGLDGTARLAELAERAHTAFLDSPVLGTRQPAENGQLTVLVGGPSELRERVAPVHGAIGGRTVWVGERPGDGHRLKLVANSWLLSITAGIAQGVALARGLGIDPSLLLNVISGGPLDSAYAQLKAKAMLEGDFSPAFGLSGARKDSELITAAMRGAGIDPRLMSALHDEFQAAEQSGHGKEDMAAVVFAFDGSAPDNPRTAIQAPATQAPAIREASDR